MLQFALLALLRPGPDYGYHLRLRFDATIGAVWCLNVGQVYQALQTLEAKGLVVEVPDPAAARDGGGPGRNRRLFAITEKGERSLERWIRRVPTRPPPHRDEILVRLLGAQSGPEALRQVFSASERAYRDRLGRALLERERVRGRGTVIGRLGVESEIAHLEAHLGWLVRCRAELLAEPDDAATTASEPSSTRSPSSPPVEPRPPARAAGEATRSPQTARRPTPLGSTGRRS